jgi:hypothetical protein
MRLPAVLLLASVAAGAHAVDGVPRVAHEGPRGVRLAGLAESVPGLFLRLVNDALMGRIEASTIHYDAPSSVVLTEARLLDPRGDLVARVQRARATLSLRDLLSGEIVVSHVELEDPSLDLVLRDTKLNLLEALTPKKPADPKNEAKGAFRIEEIKVTRGSFRFSDGDTVTVTASGIAAKASLDIDRAQDIVVVDVKEPMVASGSVELPKLAVPLRGIKARQVIVYREHVDIYDVSGTAAGASVAASGRIVVKDAGQLALLAYIDAPAGVWPARLERLPFELPALKGKVDVSGPLADPLVSADASFGAATAYGYRVDSGRGVVTINQDLVTIKAGSAVRAGGGAVHAEGTVVLPQAALDVRLRAIDVPLAAALQPAQLDPAPRGSITARAHLTGVAGGDVPLRVDASGTAHRAQIAGVAARSDLQVSAKVTIKPELVVIEGASLTGDGLNTHVDGSVFLAEERIRLDLNARADDAPRWVPDLPDPLQLGSATFVGSIAGPYDNVIVEGDAIGSAGTAYGVPLDDLRAHVTASAARVVLSAISAQAAGGSVRSTSDIVLDLKGDKSIRGAIVANDIDLAHVRATDGAELPLKGVGNAEAVLGGPYRSPTVTVRAAVGGLIVADERLGSAVAGLTLTKTLLTVLDAKIDGPLARAHTAGLRLTVDDLELDGQIVVDRLELAHIEAAKEQRIAGHAVGIVSLRGDARAPGVQARLRVSDLAFGPLFFGSGPVELSLPVEDLGVELSSGSRYDIVGIAAKLQGSSGVWNAATSFSMKRKIINADVNFSDVDLAQFTQRLGTAIAPLDGFAFGSVRMFGPLDKLSMRTRVRVPELAVTPYHPDDALRGRVLATTTTVPLLRPLGALFVEGRMDDGELAARLCAFPGGPASTRTEGVCHNDERVWASVAGSVDAQHGTFDLQVDGLIEEQGFEDIVPAIAAQGLRVGAKARVSAQVTRAAGAAVSASAQATLLEASVLPPDEDLRASLQGPAEILYDDRRARLESPARFATAGGEIDVTIGGAAGDEDIALDIEGKIALALTKLFTVQIANARGTAETELSIRGRYDEGIAVEGSIRPAPGAVITPRALGQPIQFLDGAVLFAPAPDTSSLLRITADGVRARVGDGEAQLRGSFDARTARDADEGYVARWDLALNGNGLSFKLPSGRVEGSADLALVGDESAPVLRGRIEVNDGTYRKSLELLRNFVLAAAPGRPGEPLWQTLAPVGLADLQLDVGVTMQNFRVRANVASFDADMLLRGNLRLSKMLRLPVIDGAVEVEEGEITFPKARFEVKEMQVEFPSTGDGRLHPLVHLTARAEIPPGAAGNNDTEIPVDLYLDGDLEKGINLDLLATDPVRQWSRNDLLGLILFGKSLELTVADRDISLARNALLNEATASLTAELEQLAQATLGIDVEIAATGWRWQLGRRLQVEGEVSLIDNIAAAASGSSTAAASSSAAGRSSATSSDTLRLRLLFIDHLQPFGKSLSLDGRGSAGGTDVRLSLRIFEE